MFFPSPENIGQPGLFSMKTFRIVMQNSACVFTVNISKESKKSCRSAYASCLAYSCTFTFKLQTEPNAGAHNNVYVTYAPYV